MLVDSMPHMDTGAADLHVGLLFDRVLDAVVIAHLASGTIVHWNRAAEELFGYTAAEAVGQSLEMLMPAPLASVHRAGLERYARTGHGLIADAEQPVEVPAHRKNGEDVRVALSLSEVRSPTGERFVVGVMRDVMHRKELELTTLELIQERVARAEAEAEVAARDELLDAVAAMLRTQPDATGLQRLIRVLDDFHQLQVGQLAVHALEGDLVDLVHAAADAARAHDPSRHLRVHVPPTAPARFDAARTGQILEQVLEHAISRGPAGARLDLRLEQPSAQTLQLTVRVEGAPPTVELGVGLQLSRLLMQRQGGALTTAQTPSGDLEVVLTFAGCPRPRRRSRTGVPARR